MVRGAPSAALVFSGLQLWACAPATNAAALELIGFRQNAFESVALNEELVFSFSEALDRTSITAESVRILDPEGEPAAGERLVRGSVLSFLPELPRTADLSDGGFRPGTTYRVVLGGFPRPDGIRSRDGELLSATLILSFRTVHRAGEHPLFLDPFSGPNPLLPAVYELGPEDPIRLECGEALDPTTVSPEDFELRRKGQGGEAAPESIPLEARLAVNRRERAILELRPRPDPGGATLQPDEYYLHMSGRGLKTLGGRSVDPGWRSLLLLHVWLGRFEEDFRSTRNRSLEEPSACDGTAAWGLDGVAGVQLRFPAAAGSGADGTVELRSARELPLTTVEADAGSFSRAWVQSERLTVPPKAAVDLSSIDGPVVLCAQGAIDVRGQIQRRGKKNPETLALQLENLSERVASERWPTLSAWLQDALAKKEPWTILIAGADLRIPEGGLIDVDGPLMLIAGGWIRVTGRVDAREVWKTPEGVANIAGHPPSGPGVRTVPLRIDPPATNPLRAPLHLGVLTTAIRPRSGFASWRPAVLVAHEGAGSARVRFLGRRLTGGRDEELGPWEELSRLEGCSEIRLQIELDMPAGQGEPWDPPRLERLALSWDEPHLSAERGGSAPPP